MKRYTEHVTSSMKTVKRYMQDMTCPRQYVMGPMERMKWNIPHEARSRKRGSSTCRVGRFPRAQVQGATRVAAATNLEATGVIPKWDLGVM
jgi:hypothetical protein